MNLKLLLSIVIFFQCTIVLVTFAAWFGARDENRVVDMTALGFALGMMSHLLYKSFKMLSR